MHEAPLFFHINGIPPFVTYSWVAMTFLLAIALVVRSTLKLVPTRIQNVIEVVAEFFLDLAESSIGHMGRHFFPLIATIGMYIFVCNFLGLIPGFEAPTSNLNTNASMAIPVFLVTHYYGIKAHKLGYIKHFVGPRRSVVALPLMILMFTIEVIGHLARPLTLSVRLFGNMTAKHMILLILGVLVPWIVPTTILALGVLVSVIQAFVFVLLTTLYLAGAVEEAH
jgi:F-type H+-transporting ATPase subunit a